MNFKSLLSEKQNLSMSRAIVYAFLGKEIAYYPRQGGDSVDAKDYLKSIERALWPLDELKTIDESYLDRAKDSLGEVKDLTEYQDQKSARLLTIIAFLTAAAGALFAKFVDAYPLRLMWEVSCRYGVPVLVVYLAFALFIIYVAFGALVSFHATQMRFVWSETATDAQEQEESGKQKAFARSEDRNDQHGKDGKGKSDEAIFKNALSYLFYKSILRTTPEGWANSFVEKTALENDKNVLTVKYYKNYITESYLVAMKCGDKLRYLQPAQKLLLWAIRLLIIWLLCFFGTVALVPSKAEIDSKAQANARLASGTTVGAQQLSGIETYTDGGVERVQQKGVAASSSARTLLHAQVAPMNGMDPARQGGSQISAAPPIAASSNVTGQGGKR